MSSPPMTARKSERQDALSELINLLRIRYTLSERVYYHHAKVSSGAMISKAVELGLREGMTVQELRLLKDETLITSGGGISPGMKAN